MGLAEFLNGEITARFWGQNADAEAATSETAAADVVAGRAGRRLRLVALENRIAPARIDHFHAFAGKNLSGSIYTESTYF
jgi:hypothetical protein